MGQNLLTTIKSDVDYDMSIRDFFKIEEIGNGLCYIRHLTINTKIWAQYSLKWEYVTGMYSSSVREHALTFSVDSARRWIDNAVKNGGEEEINQKNRESYPE